MAHRPRATSLVAPNGWERAIPGRLPPIAQMGGETVGSPLVCERRPYQGNWFDRGKRVVVDEDAGTVSFAYCHRPRRFWAVRTDPLFACRLSELLAVHVNRDPEFGGSACWVSTPAGRAVFDSRMAGFDEVVQVLRRNTGPNGGPLVENPHMWNAAILPLTLLVTALLFLLVWLGWL